MKLILKGILKKINMSGKGLYCFVCDIAVTNRYFSLATCRTQSSKKKLVEKLGCLVGEQYMIVITEEDVICRSCANLMNTLDRLEVEMASVKRVVLRFLERKYSLEEGELMNQKPESSSSADTDKSQGTSFMMRKKQAEEDSDNDFDCCVEDPRSRIWMQCDKCQYTTNYTSFVKNHIRDEICLDCEAPMKDGQCTQNCSSTISSATTATATATTTTTTTLKDKPDPNLPSTSDTGMRPDTETMELIVSNMSFLSSAPGTSTGAGGSSGGAEETFSLIPDPNIQGKLEVSFNVNESGELCLTEEKPDDKDNKSALYLQVVDEEDDDSESSNMRNVLTVTRDGAVEMRKVMWNEETNSPVTEMPF